MQESNLKPAFSVWKLNMGVAMFLIILSCLETTFLAYLSGESTGRCAALIAQANVLMYAVYFIGTQSRFNLGSLPVLAQVILKQIIMAAAYTCSLSWLWESVYPNAVRIPIPSLAFWLLMSYNWLLLTALGIIYYLVERNIAQAQYLAFESNLQKLKNEAELFKLRQQLHPHFLFNSLNSINALIGADPKQARTMLLKLSSFLRQTIRKEELKQVPLTAELEELDLYLDIEKVRFGDRLNIIKHLPEHIGDPQIPPFLLQPLVENAIKFGLYNTLHTVTININLKEDNHYFIFEISNPYDKSSAAPKGTGFGLDGISRRLYLLYARNDLLQIEKVAIAGEQDMELFVAKLFIPKEDLTH